MKPFLIAALLCGLGNAASGQRLQQAIKTDADFRGLSAVGPDVAWASGTKGTFGRTTDGGKTWAVGTVPDANTLDFRDVEAFSAETAYLLSAGPSEDSRVYKTTDGGKTWKLQFKNAEPKGFFDAIAFWDEKHGIALSDPVNGKFLLVTTDDGVATWTPLPEKSRPAALPYEGCFAASGHASSPAARTTSDSAPAGPRPRGCSAGATEGGPGRSARRRSSPGLIGRWVLDRLPGPRPRGDRRRRLPQAVRHGGDRRGHHRRSKTWKAVEKPLPFRSGVAWAKDRWVAVGTSGSDVSPDGATWKPLDREKYNAVAFTATGDGWAVGPKGRVARFMKVDK